MNDTGKLRVILADDHRLIRAGLRALIEEFGDYEVVAEADDGQQAVDLCVQENPEIVVLDLTMPGMNGLEATRQIIQACPNARVIILSMHATEHYVLQALCAGAKAYVVKDCAVDELEQALRLVAQGQSYLSPVISRHVVSGFTRLAQGASDGTGQKPGRGELTNRQRDILRMIAEGNTTRQIAEHLGLSPKTVETHRYALMKKLGLSDIASLTRFAIDQGLVRSA